MASPMRVLSLCTGIGGIDLAAEAAGMRIVGQVELDEFCNRVLAHHWPRVQRARDLYEVTGDEWGAIDLVVAGFPCQPASLAGKRRGQHDARWLWPEVARIIRACQPAWVLLENVPGLISLGLDDVLSDLDSAGYESAACVYPAAAVGAPHERERVFIVAHTTRHLWRSSRHDGYQTSDGASDCDAVAHANSQRRLQPQRRFTHERRRTGNRSEGVGLADASGTGLEGQQWAKHEGRGIRPTDSGTRQTQSRVGVAAHGLPRRLAGHSGWPARPGEAQHEWEAPRVVPASDRTPGRAAKLKALGNAVVPAQVLPLLLAIAETWARSSEDQRLVGAR